MEDHDVALPPLGLRHAFQGNQSLGIAVGHMKYPGGRVRQWGYISAVDISPSTHIDTTVVFPLAFTTLVGVSVTARATGGQLAVSYHNESPTGFTLVRRNLATTATHTIGAFWEAEGKL